MMAAGTNMAAGINKEMLMVALNVAYEFVPFTDLVSDIVLLISAWSSTRVIAPSDVDSCEQRALWYSALAFTVVGTLVDLVPEALLLTEIALHPEVFSSYETIGPLLRLIFSDGKPIIAFAANEEPEKSQHPSLVLIRDSLRRRLTSFAASLSMTDSCAGDQKPRWTYAGLLGIIVGGELLTGIGASLFLGVEFGWAAVISLVGSLIALLISTRCHMRSVGEMPLHEYHQERRVEPNLRPLEYLIPGPIVLVRYLLLVPVWPMIVVYAEAVSFWPFSSAHKGDHSQAFSDDALWMAPNDWLAVGVPDFDVSDNSSGLDFLYWAIVPHLLWTVISATWIAILGCARLVCWYFGHTEDWSAHPWNVYFASQESPFHVWCAHLQRALGLGFTNFISKELLRVSMGFVVLVTIISLAVQRGTCAEQEWAYVFSHLAWWGIMLIGHLARRRNLFESVRRKPLPTIPGEEGSHKPLPSIPGEGSTRKPLPAVPEQEEKRTAAVATLC